VRSGVKVDAEAIAAGTRLRVVGRAGVGVDNIDVRAASAAGILVVNAPTANTIAAAELTVGLIYALARHIPKAEVSLRRGEWRRADFVGTELRGKTLGIIGLGKIGMAVAERARAMEMSLIGSDPYVTSEAAAARGIELVEVGELLRRADVLTVHVPLLAETRGMIGADQLHLMKPGAFVINVARGGVIDEAALAEALRDGRVAGAAIDVYEHEPPRDSPLLDAPNTVLTPHLGASTREAQTKAGVEVAEQVLDALAGREPRYAVNSAGAAKRG
jgi:D-3-phosphoglycerate dehydrogenase